MPNTLSQRSRLPRVIGRVVGAVLDKTVVFSFDRTGFLVHRSQFVCGDLDADMHGKVCLITGANSGLGLETARALAQRGADVWFLCRSAEKGQAAVDEVRRETGNARLRVEQVDLASLASVRGFAQRFNEPRVDVLVNNAGVLPDKRIETEDGIELTFATNVVGPFLLTQLILPRLRAANWGRVINVSSGGMYPQKLTLADWQSRNGAFDGVAAYALTKRCEVVLTELWAEQLIGSGVTFNSMHPGWADTAAVRTSIPRFYKLMRRILRTPAEGADTIIWLAVCPRLANRTGLFWFDRMPRSTHMLPWTRETAQDRQHLWELCCELSAVTPTTVDGTAS